ncbi:MAG: hypothetical protein H0X30_05075 [Anaerolineae bacterium]|nr:hypothetical protein [Anaerolineae bacterium]
MNTWAELTDQVMLGTQGTSTSSYEWAAFTPEQALLKQLALVGAARRAGLIAQAVRSMPFIDPAPSEMLLPCSMFALDWLKKIDRASYARELIRDWCLFILERQKRVPHIALPYVLNLAATQSQWAPYLLPLVGERGRWLIDRNEAYLALRQTELWSVETALELKPAEIADDNKILITLRSQMMEGLAHE